METNFDYSVNQAIESSLKQNNTFRLRTNKKFDLILSERIQTIEGFLFYHAKNNLFLKYNKIQGFSLSLIYVPVYLRKNNFDLNEVYKYGILIFTFTHNGKIKFSILLPSEKDNQNLHVPIKGELVFDDNISDNSELSTIFLQFLNAMNKWEEEGENGKELSIDLSFFGN